MILLTDTPYPRIKVEFGGADAVRPALEIEADEFIGVKSFKAKGKRLSNYNVANVEELEPTKVPEETVENPEPEDLPDQEEASDMPDQPSLGNVSDSNEPSLFDFDD